MEETNALRTKYSCPSSQNKSLETFHMVWTLVTSPVSEGSLFLLECCNLWRWSVQCLLTVDWSVWTSQAISIEYLVWIWLLSQSQQTANQNDCLGESKHQNYDGFSQCYKNSGLVRLFLNYFCKLDSNLCYCHPAYYIHTLKKWF